MKITIMMTTIYNDSDNKDDDNDDVDEDADLSLFRSKKNTS